MFDDQINTIKGHSKFNLKEKSSEFIAEVFPIQDEESAINNLNLIKKKYFDASHHCFAYLTHNELSKYSDDGEPNGTAGIRIMNAIRHFDLTDLILVVTRYFGGIKLGVGPLGKAYYKASISVLEQSEIVKLTLFQVVQIKSDFNYISQIHRLAAFYQARIVNTQFAEMANFECYVKPQTIKNFTSELINVSNGNILISANENFIYQKCD